MPATKTYTLPLHQFPQAGRDLLAYAQKHPTLFGISVILIAAGTVTIVVPIALGFTASGVAAGKLQNI
jgi:hypothetical protein